MKNWRTANGKEMIFEELSQQHLSNIIWYHSIISPNVTIRVKALTALVLRKFVDERGSPVVSPYKPIYEFEIQELEKQGLLKEEEGKKNIYWKDKKVGYCPSNVECVIDNITEELNS